MIQEAKIQEAEIIEEEIMEEKEESLRLRSGQGKKANLYIELALFLILGVLIGIAVKTEAAKRITIGFDDYKMKFYTQNYNLNKMQDEQIQKLNEEQAQAKNNANAETKE